ncbi:little elongation complex subunit 2-like [Chrysoperla carnea]|uniref:little elongation complex subunit 2-like n=1 Tax=Chrysoperla carnea TaxID=189513 RepID=UPI001D07A72E|nr:little elongation complex subunit 2-like [Chrysoperla carnea]
MEYFRSLPWRVSTCQQLNNLYDYVTEESLAKLPILQKSSEELFTNLFNKYEKIKNREKQIQKKNDDYVRGYRPIPELATTELTIQDHKEYLELLKYYVEGNQRLTPQIKNSMMLTQNLEPKIQAERQKYAKFVEDQWKLNGKERCEQIQNAIETFFDEEWIKRIQIIDQYPPYYSTERMIPIVPKEEFTIEMKCVNNLFEMGNIQFFPKQPDKKRIFLDPNKIKHSDFYNYSNEPVSLDPTAEKLAICNKVDIVISASGIKNIMNNHAPYHKSWNLPVKIKEHSITVDGKTISKKIIYIDKALPKNCLNNVQKNYWVYKKILKPNFCKGTAHRFKQPIMKTTTVCNCSNTSEFDEQVEANDGVDEKHNNISFGIEKTLSDDESNDSLIIDLPETEQVTENDPLKSKFKRIEPIGTRSKSKRSVSPSPSPTPTEAKRLKTVDGTSKPINTRNSKSNSVERNSRANSLEKSSNSETINEMPNSNSVKQNSKAMNTNKNSKCKCKIRQLKGVNVTYKLWNLKAESNRLRKTTSQEINILVRCKIDAIQNSSGEKHSIILTPKLEYQLEYGAEICTKVDLCRQWISTSLLPGSKLMRVRIDPENSEFISLEETNTSKIANELTKFYNHNPNIGYQCLYSVLADVMRSPPGDYMLSHDPRHATFICFMRSRQTNSKFGLDLNDLKNFQTKEEHSYPFIRIDSNIILPNHIKQGVIPGLFKGVAKVIPKNNKQWKNTKKRKRKNKNKNRNKKVK